MVSLLGLNFHIYGLLIGMGILIGYQVSVWLGEKQGVSEMVLSDGLWWGLIPGILGARIYHVIDLWDIYIRNPIQIIKVWEGGLGIFGAILGGILGLWLFSRYRNLETIKILDIGMIGLPLAQAIGRWGNFFNDELWGKNGEPLFFYESLLDFVLFVILISLIKKDKYRRGLIVGGYLIGYGLIRLVLEPLRPEELIWSIKGLAMAQIISLLMIIGGVILVRKNPQIK